MNPSFVPGGSAAGLLERVQAVRPMGNRMVSRWWSSERTRRWGRHARLLAVIVAALWALEVADTVLLQGRLDRWGIRPRTLRGLVGIPLAPVLHDGLDHIAANTLSFLVLGWLVMLGSVRQFLWVTLIAALVSGLGVWLLGFGDAPHVGSSGLILGYFGYLLVRAYFERSAVTLLVAAVALFLYAGLFWGVLPTEADVSWLSHVFGLIGGIVAARWIRPRR